MNQSDTWQYVTRVKPRVTTVEYRGSGIGTLKCQEHTATETRNRETRYCDSIATIESRSHQDR
jgi:hypothetical protein